MVTGLDGSLIDGLSLLRSSFSPSAPFCSDLATACVVPPGPLSLDEPQPAAMTAASTHSAHPEPFLIPHSFIVPAAWRETRGQISTAWILPQTLVKHK